MTAVSNSLPIRAAGANHPLWPIVLILGRIAERVEAHQAAENGDAAEQNPAAPQEAQQ